MTSQTSTAMKANWRFFPTNKIRHYQKKGFFIKKPFLFKTRNSRSELQCTQFKISIRDGILFQTNLWHNLNAIFILITWQ